MSHCGITEEDLRDFLEDENITDISFVAQGQIPSHNGVQLLEKEYVGQGPDVDFAVEDAMAAFSAEYRGERVYTRGVQISSTGAGILAVFVAAIRPAPKDFSQILYDLKKGASARRAGWNGAGQSVWLTTLGSSALPYLPCFVLQNAQGAMQPGWVPSMGDMMADDWEILP
jgi:hypothetical protein